MALTYSVKIEFKEYPSGSWADWSQYLSEPPVISKRVESENEGEAGVIVFDSAEVTFRYDNGTPVYSAFSGDLSAKQRYLFRISAPKSDKSYIQLFEGMADFSTIHWPDPDEGKLIAFSLIDKLSALGIIPSDSLRGGEHDLLYERNTDTDVDNLSVFTDAGNTTEHHKWFGFTYKDGSLLKPTINSNTPFLGEIVQSPYDLTSLALVKFKGKYLNAQNDTDPMIFDVISYDTTYPQTSGNSKTVTNLFYYINLVYGQDLLVTQFRNDYKVYYYDAGVENYHELTEGYEAIAYDGIKLIETLVKSQWPEITLIKKPSNLSLNIPLEYYLKLITETPFDTDPLGALKILADTLKCYIYINSAGNLVVQSKDSLSTNGTTRTIGSTKIISKPEKRYFWDKLVDGVTVKVKSWITDVNGDYLVGASTQTKQIPGSNAFIKPKNEISKELITPDNTEITQEDLDTRAATEANNILNFYGRRRSSFDLELRLDDNTLVWELVDNLTIDTIDCFFTAIEFDLAERRVSLEAVEIAGHDYDFRQIVVGLSEQNSIGAFGGGGGTFYINVGGTGSSYVFSTPLQQSGGVVSLLTTGNFKITGSSLDTIQNILTTSTPTFNNVNLSNPGTSGQAVRADRSVLTSAPLTGGGDLTANRTLGLSYNATNLKLTTNALNTIQDIAITSSPTFTNLTLSGLIAINGIGNNYIQGNVGIGVAPTVKLQVSGDEILSGVITVNGTNNSYIAGRLGLGVTPQASTKLQVEGNIFVSGGDRVILNFSNNFLGFGTNNTERMRILAGGNVGIGTLSPNVTLEVGGNMHVSGGDRTFFNRSNNYLAFGTNNQEAFRIKNDLNIGFGLTNPVEKINLNGHFRQDGSWSLYNNFISGWTGSGWRIDYNITSSSESTIEADNMFLRGTLSVYELLIQQIRATNGSVYISACGRIKTATPILVPGEYEVVIEDPSGHGFAPFAVDDIVITQRLNLDHSVVIKRLIKRVSAVSGTTVTLTNLSGAPVDVGTFEPGDDLIRIGSTTNSARQGSLYLTADDSNSPYLDVIDNVASWSDWRSPAKLKARLGKLTGITDAVFGSLSGYGIYSKRLYFSSGDTAGISLYVDDNGGFTSGSAKFTMIQAGQTIFDFNTATSTALIAGWTIDPDQFKNSTHKIYMGTGLISLLTEGSIGIGHMNTTGGGQTFKGLKITGNPTTNYISIFANTNAAYTQGYVYQDISGKTIGLNNIRISLGDLRGIADSGFGIIMKEGSNEHFRFTELTKHIAGWNFDTTKFYKGTDIILDSSAKKVSVNNDAVKMFFTSVDDYGLKDNTGRFSLGSTNQIAGWVFDTVKIYKGSAAAGFSFNISATPYITGANSKGFEIYDATNTKIFAGLRDSSGNLSKGFDWNITTANVLTIKGDLIASSFRTAISGQRMEINYGTSGAIVTYNSAGGQEMIIQDNAINIISSTGSINIAGHNVGKYWGELTSEPPFGNVRSGDIYYNTTFNALMMRANNQWIQIN